MTVADRAKAAERPPIPLSAVANLGPSGIPEPRFGDFIRLQSTCTTGRVLTSVPELKPGKTAMVSSPVEFNRINFELMSDYVGLKSD